MNYINFMFSGFWVFVGHAILFYMFLNFLGYLLESFIQNLTVWLRGYPRRTVADEIIWKAKQQLAKEENEERE